MTTTKDTAEYLAILKRIENLSPPDKLRLAAELIENGKLTIAEAVAEKVVDGLKAFRILGRLPT